jgi:hypothetical protein
MHYDTLTIYGHVELYANFQPEKSLNKNNRMEAVSNQPTPEEDKIWAVENELFVRTSKQGGVVRIYSVDGILVKQQIILHEGETKIKLPEGVYVVTLNNSIGKKVFIND